MKNLLPVIFTLLTTSLFAQQIVTWQGGTPGKETSWEEARNWSNNQVPDENTFVVLRPINSGHHAQPTISREVMIASLEIQPGMVLTIKPTGSLIIDGEYHLTQGLTAYQGGLINDGTIRFKNIENQKLNKSWYNDHYAGNVFIDGALYESNTGITGVWLRGN